VIEIRPKIFTDKPTEKQLDMTFETKMQVMNSSAIRKISTIDSINTFTQMDTRQKAQSYNINKSILDSDDSFLDKQRSSELRRNKEEGDFLYGHVSGNSLEQFVVTKINKKGKENLRLLCIDGSDIQHKEYTVKDKSKGGQAQTATTSGGGSSLLSNLSSKFFGSKTKKRLVSSIIDFKRMNDNVSFYIVFKSLDKPYEENKEIRYRAANHDDCSNIMAKLRFLTTQ
jgi:hypothetical protein